MLKGRSTYRFRDSSQSRRLISDWDLQFELLNLDDLCVGVDDLNDSGVNRHFHPYWELKVYKCEGRTRVVMTPPETPHGETRGHCLLASGWGPHCREPMLNLTFRGRLEDNSDFLLSWKSVDLICPGGITALI